MKVRNDNLKDNITPEFFIKKVVKNEKLVAILNIFIDKKKWRNRNNFATEYFLFL